METAAKAERRCDDDGAGYQDAHVKFPRFHVASGDDYIDSLRESCDTLDTRCSKSSASAGISLIRSPIQAGYRIIPQAIPEAGIVVGDKRCRAREGVHRKREAPTYGNAGAPFASPGLSIAGGPDVSCAKTCLPREDARARLQSAILVPEKAL